LKLSTDKLGTCLALTTTEMEQLKIIHAVAADDFLHYDTKRIRSKFLMDALAQAGQVRLYYTHYDRLIAGVAARKL
jgi:5-keto 4-deoxyuronate isomerase